MEQIVLNGNNIDLLKSYPDNYFDAVVTDPPYGLGKEPNAEELMKDWIDKGYHEISGTGFMGKEWDAFVPQPIFWKEVFRVLKHGGHVVSFFGTRTYDWGVMAMRFAGFEVRDCIQWLYGSGFPKSYNIAKGIEGKITKGSSSWNKWQDLDGEKEERQLGYFKMNDEQGNRPSNYEKGERTTKVNFKTEEAKQWEGWGSALKPAHEDLVLARKPFQFRSDFVYLYENIVHNLKLQICQSKLFAKDAKEIFTLSQKELKGEGLDFAQWSVGKPFNTKEDLSVLMGMLQLELKEENSTLNIVLSWLNILEELWNVANTYTTETESSTITELRILNSLEWESIFQNIILLKDKKIDGLIANVLTAESLFSVLNLKLNDIQTHFAKENAISKVEGKDFVPNSEQIVLARKPLEKGLSIAENVLKWGVGGINIDGCRITTNENLNGGAYSENKKSDGEWGTMHDYVGKDYEQPKGRFPANLILTHHAECEWMGMKKIKAIKGGRIGNKDGAYSGIGAVGFPKDYEKGDGGYGDENGEETTEDWECHPDCPIKIIDEQSGESKSTDAIRKNNGKQDNKIYGKYNEIDTGGYSDKGGASRFFYCAKSSKSERNKGLDGFEEKIIKGRDEGQDGTSIAYKPRPTPMANIHPTVKPVKLMQYLARLITPPNGKVLDPFCGSGTTGIACKLEGFEFVGMEQDPEYTKIAQARISNWVEEIEDIKKREAKKDEPPNDELNQLTLF